MATIPKTGLLLAAIMFKGAEGQAINSFDANDIGGMAAHRSKMWMGQLEPSASDGWERLQQKLKLRDSTTKSY